MSLFHRHRLHRFWVKASLLLCSCLLGLLLSGLPQTLPSLASTNLASTVTTTDRVPANLQVGETTYRQTCGQCHWAIPPAVFPTQTWEVLLRDSSHYGVILDPILEPEKSWMRNYFRFASRSRLEGESIPYRFRQSRYLRILHPDVELPRPLTFESCVTCHPKAPEFNFRQ